MDYHIRSYIGGSEVRIDGTGESPDGIIALAQQLEAASKAARVSETKDTMDAGPQPVQASCLSHDELKKAFGLTQPAPLLTAVQASPTPKLPDVKWNPEPLVPTVDDVAAAVKLVVAKKGVPTAAALLKEHGGARADLVPAENRAAFIAKASEVAA